MSTWCFIKSTKYAWNRCISWPSLQNNQKLVTEHKHRSSDPSGMTSKLQPLDVSINTPFKHLVHKHYDAWLNKDDHIFTPSAKIKRTSVSIIVKWIPHSWKKSARQYYNKIVFKLLFV
jgi:hypothetical protein